MPHVLNSMQVEATKFTEIGFHGRDVDQIIRDLVDNAMQMTRQKLQRKLKVQLLVNSPLQMHHEILH